MESFPTWLVLAVVLCASPQVTGVSLTIQPSTSPAEGKTLEVTCNQTTLGTGIILYSISLRSSDSVVLGYIFNPQLSDYDERWETTVWRDRSNITKSFSQSFNEGFFTLSVGQLQCSDSSSLKCEITTSDYNNSPQTSVTQNVTVSGVTPYVEIAVQDFEDCLTNIDPDCDYCKNFENSDSQTTPLYARRDRVLELTCSGDIANPLSMNRVRWYKRVVNQVEEGIIPVTNYTDLTPTSQSGNSQCRTNAYSTLKYYPQSEDRELRIFCEVSYIQDSERPVVTAVQSFCVQGLIKGPDRPGGAEGPGPSLIGPTTTLEPSTSSTSPMTGVTLTILPSTSPAEGKTLEVTCNQPTLGAGVALYSISLKSSDSLVLGYTYNVQLSEYEEKWENTMWRDRSNITKSFSPSFNEGVFTLSVGQIQCSDSSSLKCEITSSDVANSPQITAAQNVTVSGVTPYVQIAVIDQQDCLTNIDPDCDYCKNFENSDPQTTPLYARRDRLLELTCSGDIANPLSMNRVRWYKRVVNQVEEGSIPVTNYTDYLTPTSGNSQCRTNAYSTLRYYPQPEDRELRIFCEVSYIQDAERPVVIKEQSFCVQGLIKGPDVPGGSEGPGPSLIGPTTTLEPSTSSTTPISESTVGGDVTAQVDYTGAIVGSVVSVCLVVIILIAAILIFKIFRRHQHPKPTIGSTGPDNNYYNVTGVDGDGYNNMDVTQTHKTSREQLPASQDRMTGPISPGGGLATISNQNQDTAEERAVPGYYNLPHNLDHDYIDLTDHNYSRVDPSLMEQHRNYTTMLVSANDDPNQ